MEYCLELVGFPEDEKVVRKFSKHQTNSPSEEEEWDGDRAASRMKDKVEKCFLSLQRIAVKYDKW